MHTQLYQMGFEIDYTSLKSKLLATINKAKKRGEIKIESIVFQNSLNIQIVYRQYEVLQ